MNVKKARVFCYFRHGIFIIVFASINSRTRKRERERERTFLVGRKIIKN